jgi:hypothetical protein
MMQFMEKDNPRNPNWSMMKLYLRKHAVALAIERWGSLTNLATEIEKRNKEKIDKKTEAVSSLFAHSSSIGDDTGLAKKAEKLTKAKRRKIQMATIVANMKGAPPPQPTGSLH